MVTIITIIGMATVTADGGTVTGSVWHRRMLALDRTLWLRLELLLSGKRAAFAAGMERCHNCGQELSRSTIAASVMTGCITCNLWTAGDAKGWTRLSVEDLRALHKLRHGGSR